MKFAKKVVVPVVALLAPGALAAGLDNIHSVTLDVRPHTTVQYSSDPSGVFGQYLGLLQACYNAWHASDLPGELVVVAPAWYDLQYYTLNGVQRTYLQWVSLYADVVDILNTKDNAAALVHSGGPGCAFAQANGRKCSFTVDTSQQDYLDATFRDNGRQQMQRELLSTNDQMSSSAPSAWVGSRILDSVDWATMPDSANGLTYDSRTVNVGVYVPVAPEAMTNAYISDLWNLFGSVKPGFNINQIVYPYTEAQLIGQNNFAALVRQAADRNATVQVLLASNDWTFSSQHVNAVNTINAVRQLMASIRGTDPNTLPTSGPTTTTGPQPTNGGDGNPTSAPTTASPTATTNPSANPTGSQNPSDTPTPTATTNPTATTPGNPTPTFPTDTQSGAMSVVASIVTVLAAAFAGAILTYGAI